MYRRRILQEDLSPVLLALKCLGQFLTLKVQARWDNHPGCAPAGPLGSRGAPSGGAVEAGHTLLIGKELILFVMITPTDDGNFDVGFIANVQEGERLPSPDPGRLYLGTEAALVYDAVHLLARALHHLQKSQVSRGKLVLVVLVPMIVLMNKVVMGQTPGFDDPGPVLLGRGDLATRQLARQLYEAHQDEWPYWQSQV